MTILILSIALKFLIQKILCKMRMKIDKVHVFSTFLVLMITNFYFVIYSQKIEFIILINSILILISYCIVNIPGAYLTSIRIKIFSIIYDEKLDISLDKFKNQINDEILFEERFLRLRNFNLLSIESDMYQLNSYKLKLLIKFVILMKLIYKMINKY